MSQCNTPETTESRFTTWDWLLEQGLPESVVERLQAEFESGFAAADYATRTQTPRLDAVSGVGPATIADLASLSPLTPPGEWDATKSGPADYEFTANGAVVRIAPNPERKGLEVRLRYDGDASLIHTYHVERAGESWSRVEAWWSAKWFMQFNPEGPGSAIPQNVTTPDEWRLWKNHYTPMGDFIAGWEHTVTKARLDVAPAEDSECQLVYQPNIRADHISLETGAWEAMLDAVEAYTTGERALPDDTAACEGD